MSSSKADFRGISPMVTVHGGGPGGTSNIQVPAREAEGYLGRGLRVTDRYGVDLHVEDRGDGNRRVVTRGEDLYATFLDNNRREMIERAQKTDDRGRPIGLPERVITDYEAGK